jgi:hypothetical protein
MDIDIVKTPSTANYELRSSLFESNLRKKSHCHPERPCLRSSFKIPDAKIGLKAFPPNIPKKRMATRFATSFFLYQVERVYTAPGIYLEYISKMFTHLDH